MPRHILMPVLLAALLVAVGAAAQQTGPAASAPGEAACIGDGPIVDGYPRPPTPAEVEAREASPACRNDEKGAPSVDFSPQAGDKLDKIYRKLLRIDRRQGDGGGG
jgi:hypothetical protein